MQEYTYKFRIYPDEQQKELIAKTHGCVRVVYNHLLEKYKSYGYSSKYDNNNYCNRVLKEELTFLKEVDKFALTNAIYHLDNACKRDMEKISGCPKFKSKRNIQSYQTNYTNNNIEVLDDYIKLPKLKKVKAHTHRKVEGQIVNAVVKRYPSGKYYCMILVRREIEKKPKNGYIASLDMGVKTFVVDNQNNKYDAPKNLIASCQKIAKLQRKLSFKQNDGKNYHKVRIQLAKEHEKCNNIRNDFLQKLSSKLINENQVIIVEDLDVLEMFQRKSITRILGDISISNFIRMLEYKANYYGKKVIKVNKYFPSSQLCSNCGYQNKEVKNLSIRDWICPECGCNHDRDFNACENLLFEGLKYLYN